MSAPDAISAAPPPAAPWTRLLYWSVRRELWEHRAVHMAPLVAAAVGLLGFLIGAFRLPRAVRAAIAGVADPKHHDSLMLPYSFIGFAVLMTGLIVMAFYCLDALHGERRDRSILFWKSLPVSDLIAVLAKAAVALVVLPAIIFIVIVAAHVVVLALSTLIVLANGLPVQALWSRLTPGFMWGVLAIGLAYFSLWYAPVCAWLLLVSVWARRMPVLWALAPPIAIAIVERLAVGRGGLLTALMARRLTGGFAEAFTKGGLGKAPLRTPADLDLLRMLATPDLWIGLAVAALLLALAIRLRRLRAPI